MRGIRRKLILSLFSVVVVFACAVTTTYAWFARNKEAWIDDFELEFQEYDGVYISVDGKNFSSNIDKSTLTKAIVAKKNNVEFDDPILTSDFISSEVKKIKFADITTNDLVNYKTVDINNQTNGYYNLKDASKYTYVSFDLYFKAEHFSNYNPTAKFNLRFVSDSYIRENSNSTVWKSYIKTDNVTTRAIHAFDTLSKHYDKNEEITLNPADAFRLGVKDEENTINVYEPNQGASSYALEGGTGIYDPLNNMALQYGNSYAKYQVKPLSKTADDKFDYEKTHKDFGDDVVLGVFTPENGEYNIIKLEFSIWLEGFDGDYIAGSNYSSIHTYLSFYKEEIIGGDE